MKKIVILLHGVGSNGNDLLPLGKHWATTLDDTLFVSPNAPLAFDQGVGYQWFSIAGVTEQNRPERVASARADFDAVLQEIFSTHDINPQTDKVVLVGFSQGSIMALDALVSGRFPLTAVVAFSGRLSSVEPFTPVAGAPVLLIHGTHDPVISWKESQSAAERLEALGVNVQVSFEQGTPHTITAAGASRALSFITDVLTR